MTSTEIKRIQGIVGATQDGVMGPDTKKKITAYQQTLGVAADGIWGPQTETAYNNKINQTTTPTNNRNDETAHDPTNPKSPYYGAPTRFETTERQDASIIGGTSGGGIQSAAVSSKIIDATFMKNEITAHPDILAFYVNAMTYGGYTVGDILNDMKRREMIHNKDPKAIGMEAVISSSQTRDVYLATPEGKKSITDTSAIIPTFNLQGQFDSEILKYGANMPDDMFKMIVPLLDPKSQEFKDAVDQVKSIFYDLENAKLQATNEQQKTLADTNYADFKEQLNKKYGILLSDDASKAWGQLETLSDTYNTRGLAGSGMEAEARDTSLKGIRLTDQRNRDQKLTDEESKMAAVYQSSATPEQIQTLIAEDQAKGLPKEQWRAYKWGLVPSDDFKNTYSIASLKEKYPDATPEEIKKKHDSVLDQYGNLRSTIYSNYYTGLSTNYTAEKDTAGASVTAKALATEEKANRDYTTTPNFSQSTEVPSTEVNKGITTNTPAYTPVVVKDTDKFDGNTGLANPNYKAPATISNALNATANAASNIAKANNNASIPAKNNTTPTLGSNITSRSTKDIQTKLGVASDGIIGPKTTAAIKAYQSANGLNADGIVGPKTLAKMFG